jgi:DNA-binding transcriptional regulator YiaG
LGALLGIAQRTVEVVFGNFKQRFSTRKLIPVNVKTLGDHLLLQRIKADLSQPELGKMLEVSTRTVRKWEHGEVCPTEENWQKLIAILQVDSAFAATQAKSQESCAGNCT